MKIALVAFSDKQEFRQEIRDEMERRGHICDLLHFPVLLVDRNVIEGLVTELSKYDVVHFVLGLNDEITKLLQIRLMQEGVICPNQRIKITDINDKLIQMVVLAKDGLPIPKTARLMNPEKDETFDLLGTPFVLKEPRGSMGEKVYLCTQENFDEVVRKNKEYLGQEFIKYTADYRVHIAGDNAFCIYERTAPDGDFRANVSLGGSMTKVEIDSNISERLSQLALQVAAVIGLDYGGIDILRDENDKLFVLEVNTNPGFKNVTDITGDIFSEPIATYYESLVN